MPLVYPILIDSDQQGSQSLDCFENDEAVVKLGFSIDLDATTYARESIPSSRRKIENKTKKGRNLKKKVY